MNPTAEIAQTEAKIEVFKYWEAYFVFPLLSCMNYLKNRMNLFNVFINFSKMK